MTYVVPVFKPYTSPDNFGGLRNDANRNVMQGANYLQTQDNTGTPVTSPVTVNTTKTLVVPPGAISVVITSVTNAVQVSEDSSQTAYFSLPAAIPWEFACANLSNIYLKTSGSTVVSFYFNVV